MRVPTGEIVSVGTELLLHGRKDTNAEELSRLLTGLGFRLRRRSTVGDDALDLVATFREAGGRSDLVLATGGLGPTADDRTRDAAATAFGLEMHEDPDIVRWLQERFRSRGMPMPRSNLRQAQVPEGASVLPNHEGSAPGLWIEHPGGAVLLLPGPPVEMRAVLSEAVLERIRDRFHPPAVARRNLLTSGVAESDLEDRLGDAYHLRPEATVTVLASPGLVEVLVLARHEDVAVAEAAAEEVAALAAKRIGPAVFGTGQLNLAAHVGGHLRAAGQTVAVAESCTGGLLGAELTGNPGSSDYFVGGVLAYSDEVKTEELGVPVEVLETHGAVSAPTARAMAEGVRARLGTDYGVSITGIAGPDGGTPAKPVGTVCVAVADRSGTVAKERRFHGGRDRVRLWSVAAALHLLRRRLEEQA